MHPIPWNSWPRWIDDQPLALSIERRFIGESAPPRGSYFYPEPERGTAFTETLLSKDKFPRCWDSSAAGHVNAGEAYRLRGTGWKNSA
jgi:hypothetical protein